MLSRIRYSLADLFFWLRTHLGIVALGLIVAAAAAVVALFAAGELGGDEEPPASPAPPVIVSPPDEEPEGTEELGFPAFATRNTTRVAGADPIADAAAVALAAFPTAGAVEGPGAVTLVDSADWPAGIAAAALVAEPVGAPILFTEDGDLPDLTRDALETLAPAGGSGTDNRQAFVVGDAAAPRELRTLDVAGENPAAIAAAIAKLRRRLSGADPAHFLIASSDQPGFAMPAASWAARSGDPVLFAQRRSVPGPTLRTLERHEDVPVYILGPRSAISAAAERQIGRATNAPVRRAADDADPVANAVAFARYLDADFGWNINDPGHGFVIASTTRPADAAAAAPLSAGGTWGPLLLTDEPGAPPPALEGYLLDLKPGYDTDPTRAIYNHIWLIGNEAAISVDFQVRVDELAEVAPIRSGSGRALLGPAPGTPEREPRDR